MEIISKNKPVEWILPVILIGLIPILSTSKTLDPNQAIQFIALTFWLLITWFVFRSQKKEFLIKNRILLVYFAVHLLFIVFSIVSVAISNNRSDAVIFFSKYVLFFLLISSFQFFQKPESLFKIVAVTAAVVSILISIPAYFQLFELIKQKELIIPSSTYSISSLLPHRNLLSEILVFTIPFTAFLFFSENKYQKITGIAGFNLAVFLILILSNRASWLSVAVVIIAILLLSAVRGKFRQVSKPAKFIIANTLIIFIAGYLFLSVYSDNSSLKSHTLSSLDYTKGSTKDRIGLWSRTLKLVSEKPVAGAGLGSWKINMLKYGNQGLVSENNTTFYQRPHNDFLWVAAEQGIIGFILYALLFIVILFYLLKALISKNDDSHFKQLLVILSVTLIFIVFSLFSFPKERISHNIFLFAGWGIFLNIMNTRQETAFRKITPLKGGYYSTLVILILILFIGIIRINGEIHAKKAILARKESKFQKCINEINKGESFLYRMDETSTPLCWYSGISYFRLNEYEKANAQFESAIQINPYHIYSLSDYASSLAKLNQTEKAIEFYNKAIAIAPNFLDPKLNLCALYFKEGNYSQALEILKTTDVETTSERYKKTVTVIIQKIIEKELKTTQPFEGFLYLYHKEYNNYSFYKELLRNAKSSDLHADELIIHSQPIFSNSLKN